MRGTEGPLSILATTETGGGWAGDWPALLDSPAELLGVVALVVLLGAFAGAGVRALGGRGEGRRGASRTSVGRAPVVVMVDLELFSDQEIVRLLRLRGRARGRMSGALQDRTRRAG